MHTGPTWLFDNSPIPDPFGYGQRALDALASLRHPKSRLPDQALQLDPWQQRIIRKIYGPCYDNGQRICRTVFLQIGRGNRKTSLGACLVLLHTCGPERVPGGQNLIAAADRKQARIGYEEAASIIAFNSRLAKIIKVQDFRSRISHPASGSVCEALSADGDSNFGKTPNFALVDELWAHRKVVLWHAIRTGLAKVPGSLGVIATTAGRGTGSPDYPILQYAKRVASGEIVDPGFLPIIFEADSDCDWTDEAIWHAVNPGLQHGYPDLPALRQLAGEARERPADRAAFLQFHLGIRQQHSVAPFVDMSVYDEGAAPIDPESLRGRKCFVAGDMSSTTDLSAVVVAFPDDDGGATVLPFFFVPRNQLQHRADQDGVPYVRWADQGLITATEGNAVDYRQIEQKIRNLHSIYDVREDAFDKAYAQPVMGPLLDDGFPVITLPQGWVTQSPALNLLERAIVERKFRHGGHPVLRWCFANVVVHTDSVGNRTMHKGKSKDRIDGASATWMAVLRALGGTEKRSIYDRPELWSTPSETAPTAGAAPSSGLTGALAALTTYDPEILKDPGHPEWEQNRQAFERQLALANGDDESDW